MRNSRFVLLACACAGFLVSSALAAPITAPYSENFDSYALGDTPVSNFTESNTAVYTVVNNGVTGDNQYRASLSATGTTGTGANGSAGVQITNVVGNSFHIQTDLILRTVTASSGSTMNCGLGLFGNTADFSSGSQYRLLYTVFGGNLGKLTLTENATQAGLTGTLTSASTIPVVIGTRYTLSADISYTGSNLNINGTLTDGVNSITISGTDTSPQAGQFFGYRTAINAVSGTATQTVDYDNFSVSVPEPGSLLGLAGIALCLTRRRR